MDATGSSYISDISIYTDAPALADKNIECYSTSEPESPSIPSKQLIC